MLSIDLAQAWMTNGNREQVSANLNHAKGYLGAVSGINPDALSAIDGALRITDHPSFDLDVFHVIRTAIVRPTERLEVGVHPS